jgi:hypothetical protein
MFCRLLVYTLGFLGFLFAVCRLFASVIIDRLMIDTEHLRDLPVVPTANITTPLV